MDSVQHLMTLDIIIQWDYFGSQYIGCATPDSDTDVLVLVKRKPRLLDMEETGFFPSCSDPLYGLDFSSWRNEDNINLVFTDSEVHYRATMEAARFCRKYKVFDKTERINVHEGFRLLWNEREVLSNCLIF